MKKNIMVTIIAEMKELATDYEETKEFFGSSENIDEYNKNIIRYLCYRYHKDTDLYLKFFYHRLLR